MRLRLHRPFALFLALLPAVAAAHPGHADTGFAAGFVHPLNGLDHLLAMAAVGWWSATLQPRQRWIPLAAFVVGAGAGAVLGACDAAALAVTEIGVAVSLVVLGLLLAGRRPLPLVLACAIAGGFAICHGYAHGSEIPAGTATPAWLAGMLLATALLPAAGATIGRLAARCAAWPAQMAGLATAVAGVALLVAGASGAAP
ncbi:HupE/UreJ family protein [Tahibacter caeni]|uniref:HupE/UreJ family protein n=1 Tax=Tahibacter caeni TaxID=1453545 RepID=UPI0021490851|nr:HupE/UreJ family protein [Tahibacter caeni]